MPARRDARRQTLAILPLFRDLPPDLRPIAALECVPHGARDVADAREAFLHVAIPVDVPLGDLPVVDARVPGGAGVGEHEAPLELSRRDRKRNAAYAVDRELDGRDSAIEGRPIVLDTRRHVDRLRLDVHRNLHQALIGARLSAPRPQGAADRDVERGGARDAGADRRLRPRVQLQRVRLKVVQETSEQPQFVVVAQLAPVRDVDAPSGVAGDDREAAPVSRLDHAPRAEADRRIDGLRAIVKEIQGPDIERATRQVDTSGSRGLYMHVRSIDEPVNP